MTGLSKNKRRRNAVLRAALIALVSASGCQSPMRSWRKEDPSILELMVNPQPWDAQNAQSNSSAPNYKSNTPNNNATPRSRSSNHPSSGSRANPYAAYPDNRPGAQADPRDEVDEFPIQDEDAVFKKLLSKTDPAHREMLAQTYRAVLNHAASQNQRDTDAQYGNAQYGDAEYGDSEYDSGAHDADERESTSQPHRSSPETSITKIARIAPPARSEATEYHLSDNDEPLPGRRQSLSDKTRSKNAAGPEQLAQDDLGNSRHVSDPNVPVHLTLNDRESANIRDTRESRDSDKRQTDYANTNTNTSRRAKDEPRGHVQELKPPSGKRIERALVQQPVADTGAGDDVRVLPPTRESRQIAAATSSRRPSSSQRSDEQATEYETTDADNRLDTQQSSRQADNSYVALASAESSVRDSSQVQLASNETSSRSTSRSESTTPPAEQDWREHARQLVRTLEQAPIDDDSPNAQLHRHITLRVMHVLLGELEPAMEPIPGLEANEQEYCRHSLQALYHTIDPHGNPVRARRWPVVLDDNRSAISYLGAASNLEVKNAAFCSNVDGYGSITKFPTNQFRANQEMLLYCEVDNFVSAPIKDGFETKLRGNYEIVDARQARVADVLLPEEVDICKRQRRDYFFVYRIYAPQNIAPGRYQLRLTIEDVKGNKFGQTQLDMQIVQ